MWKKLLYLKQPFPDNYTDESFLDQLKTNLTVVKYSYWKLVYDFSLISMYISSLLLVILTFTSIYYNQINPIIPIIISSLSLMTFLIGLPKNLLSNTQNIKSFLLINFILLVLSPLLKSLTRSTSSDSIWALSFILCLINIVFHDYAMDISKIINYRPILSTNISMANGIVLASRLSSNLQVYCFLLFVLQFNILLPFIDFSLRKFSRFNQHYTLLISIQLISLSMIWKLANFNLFLIYFSGQIGILFCLPGYFLFLQKYKNELQGPWDPAKPIIKTI